MSRLKSLAFLTASRSQTKAPTISHLQKKSSAFVNQEIGYAEKSNKLIIPLVERGIATEGALAGVEYISYERGRDADAFSVLCQALHNFLLKKFEEQKKHQAQQVATVVGGAVLVLGLIALLAAFGRKK